MNDINIKSETLELIADRLGATIEEIHAVTIEFVKTSAEISLWFSLVWLASFILSPLVFSYACHKTFNADDDDLSCYISGAIIGGIVALVLGIPLSSVEACIVNLYSPEAVAIFKVAELIN